MNNPTQNPGDPLANATREEIISALFANMVIQQTNMAMMLLGKVAHPETGEFMKDVDSARMFIDQLEMLEAKTKGNLNKQEEGLMKQALTALRMAFVEAVDEPAPTENPPQPEPQNVVPAHGAASPVDAKAPSQPDVEAAPSEESRKKFSKKY